MSPTIRPYTAADLPAVVDLALRAWTPVFESMRVTLGARMFALQHPDWRADQRAAVELVCGGPHVWVAEVDGAVAGFVAARPDAYPDMGEIDMLAVDPERQGGGIGAALTAYAVGWLREQGMTVATVETGGDPGHAAARATYERAGFTIFPVARYFLDLT